MPAKTEVFARDRAAAVSVAIIGILANALRRRSSSGDLSALAEARVEILELLRDEFADAVRQAVNEIRLVDE